MSRLRIQIGSASPAFTFVLTMGVVNLFADTTYEGGASINGPFLGTLGATAVVVSITAGVGEFLGYSLRSVAGYFADKTGKYWVITFIGYGINLLAVPAMALAGNWQVAAALILAERIGRALRNTEAERRCRAETGDDTAHCGPVSALPRALVDAACLPWYQNPWFALARRSSSSVSSVFSRTSSRAQDLPVFDAHIHYSQPDWSAYSPDAILALFDKTGVRWAIVSSTPDDGTVRLYEKAPDRIAPVLRPYRTRADMGTWTTDASIVSYVQERLKRGVYKRSRGVPSLGLPKPETPWSRNWRHWAPGMACSCTRTRTPPASRSSCGSTRGCAGSGRTRGWASRSRSSPAWPIGTPH